MSLGKCYQHLPTARGSTLAGISIRGSPMALDCASVLAYLEKHTQLEAAAFFGVSDRSIRRLVKAARPEPVVPARPVPTSSVPQLPSSPSRPVRVFVPRSAADVAGPCAYWLDYAGALVRVTPGTTGAVWNALQLPLLGSSHVPMVAGVPAVSSWPALESGSSSNVRPCPVVVGRRAPVALHNGGPALLAPVKGYALTMVGPGPVLGLLLALLLIVIMRGGF
jgi:hypothetical protein